MPGFHHIAYACKDIEETTRFYEALGFPPTHFVDSFTPTQGWVAVGEHAYRSWSSAGWWWLRGRPYRRVGASIRLYYIP